ncbi:TetR/AcrR family transcriptional regulator [Leucobacter albus]|uniref:TetR/AcrR family transcriptional regulator n=1 Tax=Leucobacter albus TaxID=272210 RepID=A0ABW3TPC4_9MICO
MTEAEVSRTLAIAWGLAAAPQRGPKRELSLERIVDAAIEIADAEGLAAVTMQRVAKTFDFSTMALYRYVSTKDDLHQLMLDAAMTGGLGPIGGGDWREGCRALLRGLVLGYRAHPWVLDISLTPDIHMMPGQIRVADLGLGAMRDMPVPETTKLAILILISSVAQGHAAVEREVLAGAAMNDATRALIEEAVTVAEFPNVAAFVRSGSYFGDHPGDHAGGRPGGPPGAAEQGGEKDIEGILSFTTEVVLAGLAEIVEHAPGPEPAATTATQLAPPDALAAAEGALAAHIELRKATQQRLRDLERQESGLVKARDRAKELAKAHSKLT